MLPVRTTRKMTVKAKDVKSLLPLMIIMVIIFLVLLFWENEVNDEVVTSTLEHLHVDYPQNDVPVPARRDYTTSEMESFPLLLLSLGLVLAEASESTMKIIKEEFTEEEMQYDMAKSSQEKQTIEILMNSILLVKNTSLSMSKDDLSSSLLTFRRLHYNDPKGNSSGNDKECCNDMTVWRKVSEANRSCKWSNNLIHDSTEVMHRVHKAPSCKFVQNPGISCGESPELENTVCQLTTDKQFPRCQYHSVTSLEKILTVLTGHSLMSWLVCGSKL
ncbi:probable ribonuclease 11 isoform X2 [Trachypithecus francoisi]|uniref:probable ribonuclease 11 isoform X2 n=1 Tax=Trachypithecus francoisi TaxID=54180 RepID=UPI00141BF254|nr:probable ribonuclease 11 isoform X2 [Trachypithecus francoisi]